MTESDPKEKKNKERCYPHNHYRLPQLLQKPKHGEGREKKSDFAFFFFDCSFAVVGFYLQTAC